MTTLNFKKVNYGSNKSRVSDKANVGYGIFDSKRREVGDSFLITQDPFLRYEYVKDENGNDVYGTGNCGEKVLKYNTIYAEGKFSVIASTTRNGVEYGSAITKVGLFDSYEEAVAAIQAFIPKRIAKLKKKFDKAA